MNVHRATFGLLAVFMLSTASANAQSTAPAEVGIRLEHVDYAYPVRILPLRSQGQDLEMAYMEIVPANPDDANDRTVFLLHGKNFNGDYWGRTARDLAAAGFRVVVPDQIGFGKSSKPERYQFTFQQLAANTVALADALDVKEFAVVGHSMGGMLAVRLVLMHPQRVSSLVLVNPIGLEDWKTTVPYRTIDQNYQSELKQDQNSIRAYMQKVYYDGKWSPEYDRPVELLAGMTRSAAYPKLAWVNALTSDMIMTQPVVYEFPNIRTPTLLIIGTRDRTAIGKDALPPEEQERLGRYDRLGKQAVEAIPQAKLIELNGVGHMPMLEAYDRYIDPLRSFLSE